MIGNISKEKLEQINSIYYHGSCADGITAREILKKCFFMHDGKIVEFKNIKTIPYYFDKLEEIPNAALFIDCSPRFDQLEDCLKNNCCIADHHETFKDGFDNLNDKYKDQMLFGENDKGESGAVLAYYIQKQFNGKSSRLAQVASLIAISDTWKIERPEFKRSRKMAKFISFFDNDFNFEITDLLDRFTQQIDAFGIVFEKQAHRMAANAVEYNDGALKVAFINELNISDAAEILRKEKDIDVIVGWKVQMHNNIQTTMFSIRSNEKFNCAKFAERFHGGGHARAAGFKIINCDNFVYNYNFYKTMYEDIKSIYLNNKYIVNCF